LNGHGLAINQEKDQNLNGKTTEYELFEEVGENSCWRCVFENKSNGIGYSDCSGTGAREILRAPT
jgi:hypothetical protein